MIIKSLSWQSVDLSKLLARPVAFFTVTVEFQGAVKCNTKVFMCKLDRKVTVVHVVMQLWANAVAVH